MHLALDFRRAGGGAGFAERIQEGLLLRFCCKDLRSIKQVNTCQSDLFSVTYTKIARGNRLAYMKT
jgi:hypothetical protein